MLRWWRDLCWSKKAPTNTCTMQTWADAVRDHASTLSTAQIAAFIRRLLDTMAALDANVSPRLALETLMLNVE